MTAAMPSGTTLDEPPVLHVPTHLVDYACNLQGCCCGGWRIPFKPDDIVRLARALPDDQHSDGIADGLIIVTEEDHRTIDHLRLQGVGDDDHCRFLDADGGCGVQRSHGTDALPDLCIQFPAFIFVLGDRFEAHHQPICPEVIRALGRHAHPFGVSRLEPPHSEGLALRLARGCQVLGRQTLHGVDVGWDGLFAVRDAVVAALADEGRPVLETLSAICHSLGRLSPADTDPRDFGVTADAMAPGAFVSFLFDAMNTHQSDLVESFFWRGRRFMLDLEFPEGQDWSDLRRHLAAWQPALVEWVEPVEPALRPLLVRFAALRYFQAPAAAVEDLRESLGTVPLVVALALRVTAALSACLGRVADERVLRVALTTAEYVYRNTRYPATGFPWFTPSR